MAPGAKKKNVNRKSADTTSTVKKSFKNVDNEKSDDCSSTIENKEGEIDLNENQGKKYSKRTVTSNWKKYEETPIDPFADKLRGKDYEVLVSYSGGAGSHLQLQGEKEWEEADVDAECMSLDLKELIHVVKSIPFHKRINLSSDIFNKDQLSKIESSAENWKNSYVPNIDVIASNKVVKKEKVLESLDSDLNIIDNGEPESIEEEIPTKSVLLEANTETIIESLASCLSLKAPVVDKLNEAPVANKIEEAFAETKKETNISDDLDFLLSLNVSLKKPLQEEKQNEKQTNVDDWLNSILDD